MFGRNILTEVGPPRWNRSGRRDCADEVDDEEDEEAEEEKDYWEVVGGGHWDWGDSRTQSRTIALAAEDMILVVVAARTSEMAEGSMLDIAV